MPWVEFFINHLHSGYWYKGTWASIKYPDEMSHKGGISSGSALLQASEREIYHFYKKIMMGKQPLKIQNGQFQTSCINMYDEKGLIT